MRERPPSPLTDPKLPWGPEIHPTAALASCWLWGSPGSSRATTPRGGGDRLGGWRLPPDPLRHSSQTVTECRTLSEPPVTDSGSVLARAIALSLSRLTWVPRRRFKAARGVRRAPHPAPSAAFEPGLGPHRGRPRRAPFSGQHLNGSERTGARDPATACAGSAASVRRTVRPGQGVL